MERHMDELLASLKLELTKMSALAESMIHDAITVLTERDQNTLAAVQAHEKTVNRMQVEIDEACLRLIALHQPAASDLRFILGVAKTNADLERLADQAVNISEKAVLLLQEPPLKRCEIIVRMAKLAAEMLKDSLHSFVNRDTEKARSVLMRDDALDAMKAEVTEELTVLMTTDGATVRRAIALALVAGHLERIGDHATNIAENTIFIKEGKDIRHGIKSQPESSRPR